MDINRFIIENYFKALNIFIYTESSKVQPFSATSKMNRKFKELQDKGSNNSRRTFVVKKKIRIEGHSGNNLKILIEKLGLMT